MTGVTDSSWMIGGPQGSGVDSSATLFARTMAVAGYWIYGKREYHSNIKGKHSYFQIRIKTENVRSHVCPVHLLATFEDETAVTHAHEIVPNGAMIYDPHITKPESLEINPSVTLFTLAYDEAIKELAEELGKPAAKLGIVKNTMAVAASCALYGLELSAIKEALEGLFRGKKAGLVAVNYKAAEKAYALIQSQAGFADFAYKMTTANAPAKGSRLLMNGAVACGLGKLKAGCRFQTYYSITPAVDECIYLESQPDYGIIVFQAEDELAAVNMTNGAAYTGTRSSTATSGPGFSLMAEGIGWASMNEVPSVIFNYQRGGPSTGLPTRHEQADLLFALNIGHGESPHFVMAPGDNEECFEDGFNSFNIAERYQNPVIVLVDKALANSTQTVPRFNEEGYKIDRGIIVGDSPDFDPEQPETGLTKFKRFEVTESGVSPRALPGTPGRIHWLTGDEHTEYGFITELPSIRMAMHEKRMRKLSLASKEIPQRLQYNLYGPEEADLTLVGWGSTKGIVLDAMQTLAEAGTKVNFLHIRLMSPFPVDAVTAILNKAKRLVSIESNFTSQLRSLIRMETGIFIPHEVVKYTGRPISETEVLSAVREILANDSRKVVLSSGH
jgi:2-oxoglutarate/2-oxoacid ferredoxin oxidoreductase subunit alpha